MDDSVDGVSNFFAAQLDDDSDYDVSHFFAAQQDIINALAAAELPEVDLSWVCTAFSESLRAEIAKAKMRVLDQLLKGLSGCCRGRCGQYGIADNFLHPVAEIKEVMEVIHRRGNAIPGHTWMLCKLCNCISTCVRFGNNLRASVRVPKNPYMDVMFCEHKSIHKPGEGVVGKAASSRHHMVYCEDVTKFNPFALFSSRYNHPSRCAISLQSIYTGDQVYVMEFFLDPSRELGAVMVSIFQAMRQNFRTFKLSSGKEFGGTLAVQIIDASSPDKIAILENWLPDLTLTIGVNSGKVIRPYLLQGSIGETSVYGTDDSTTGMETSIQDTSMEEAQGQSFSTVKSEFCMTVKVYYGDDFIPFQLSDSSGIDTLKELVSQRFKLGNGTYIIMYQDEANDPVLIECDEDVHEYISCSTSLGVYILSIELKDS